jgi:hypothetical protein
MHGDYITMHLFFIGTFSYLLIMLKNINLFLH